MTPTRLVLIRHAEPDADARRRCYGRLDVDLCADGHARARTLAADLARGRVAAVYTSPLGRARATAAPIAEAFALEPVIVDDLRELDFGDLDGLLLDEIVERHPEFLAWTNAPAAVRFPGGESVAALRERVLATTADIRRRHEGETVAVVTHAVPIRVVLADALGLPLDGLFRLDQGYGGVSIVDWFGETPLVRLVNASARASRRLDMPPPAA